MTECHRRHFSHASRRIINDSALLFFLTCCWCVSLVHSFKSVNVINQGHDDGDEHGLYDNIHHKEQELDYTTDINQDYYSKDINNDQGYMATDHSGFGKGFNMGHDLTLHDLQTAFPPQTGATKDRKTTATNNGFHKWSNWITDSSAPSLSQPSIMPFASFVPRNLRSWFSSPFPSFPDMEEDMSLSNEHFEAPLEMTEVQEAQDLIMSDHELVEEIATYLNIDFSSSAESAQLPPSQLFTTQAFSTSSQSATVNGEMKSWSRTSFFILPKKQKAPNGNQVVAHVEATQDGIQKLEVQIGGETMHVSVPQPSIDLNESYSLDDSDEKEGSNIRNLDIKSKAYGDVHNQHSHRLKLSGEIQD